MPRFPLLFLLSPARCAGARADLLLRDRAAFELARRLKAGEGVSLGEVFTFLSGLYFRGKLAYASAFARAPDGLPGVMVMTPDRGLLSPGTKVTRDTLIEFRRVPIDTADDRYTRSLTRSTEDWSRAAGPEARVVLLGSIATGKYVDPLMGVLGERLLFPADFVGRGDMSRGGLLLRSVRQEKELAYIPVVGAVRRGHRPPRLGRP